MRYRPTELLALLSNEGAFPKKRLSQNFLIDGNVVRKIVKLAQVEPQDHVLEIGPGPGALTEALLGSGASVTAVEIDPVFARKLEDLQSEDKRLRIIEGDILKQNVTSLSVNKVVANLPYHITTPVLTRLLPLYPQIDRITVMVQKEVALRFTAKPGTPEWSSFSLFLNFYSTPTYGFTVPPTCFFPKPSVESALVTLKLHSPPLVEAEPFFAMTRLAFQGRRKMLKSALKKLYPQEVIAEGLQYIGKNPEIRGEMLGLEEFLKLYLFVSGSK